MWQRWEIYFSLIIMSTFFSYTTLRRWGMVPVLLATTTLVSAIFIFQMPLYTSDILSLRLRLVSARSFCLVVMWIYLITSLNQRGLDWLIKFFEAIAVIMAFMVLFLGWSFFRVGSMDLTFLAMLTPMLLLRKRPISLKLLFFMPFVVSFCFARTGSTVFVVLLVGSLTYFIIKRRWAYLLFTTTAISIAAYFANGSDLLYHKDRTSQWKLFLEWWQANATIPDRLIGVGTGTFQWVGPSIQEKAGETNLFVWAHNDYLQVMMEQGIVGLILMLILIGICLKRSYKNTWLFVTCVAILPAMFVQFPLRFPLSQLFILLIVRLSLESKSTYRTCGRAHSPDQPSAPIS